ncbi:MerR family transcriptional regulator [Nocardiopsis sp. CNT312]|uniref:MerR family transcriptional regulator n=1 Tax=Nocardiopsis sp. CNT312 TaxID=1137268 RepID=UPI0004AD3D0B|nr:MerR family transcriptional regulator [Nocardiopsis sp. CNT312]
MSGTLSPGAAARLLGVAPSTLRSWDRRYGVGPHGRSPGGHRRYTPEDMDRLRELCRLVGEGVPPADAAQRVLAEDEPAALPGSTPPAPGGTGDGAPASHQNAPTLRSVNHAAMRLDAELVEELLEDVFTERGVVAAWEELAMPLLYGMGRKWEASKQYVEVEHLLSWCVSSVLRRVQGPTPGGGGRPVLLACGPHETHSLPMEALAAALREAGEPHRMLGPCTPVEAVTAAARRSAPRAVVVWSQGAAPGAELALLATVRAVSDSTLTTRLLTAGPGWGGLPEAMRLRDGHLSSLDEAFRVLVPRAAAPRTGPRGR